MDPGIIADLRPNAAGLLITGGGAPFLMAKSEDPEDAVLDARARALENPGSAPDVAGMYRQHSRRLLAAAYRVTGNAQDAEDVLQTVFLRLVRRESGPELGGDLAAYLHRAAVNAGLDLIRSRQAARSEPLSEAAERETPAPGQAPDAAYGAEEIKAGVRRALATLSPRAAEVFALRYFEGYDNHEIAALLGSSRSTINVILHRARERVREAIGPLFGPLGEAS
jgi:RNA polymerase sigma-70 factor, ECF subfamily